MPKYTNSIRLILFIVLSSFLLTGCGDSYNPQDDTETEKANRTFAVADVYPYPGKDYQVSDKEIGKSYDLYIYIVNNGGHDKDVAADAVKVTLIDETHSLVFDVATVSISEGIGYAVIKDLSFGDASDEARVHFHIEGYIERNNDREIYAKANSNSFYLKNPSPVDPPPSDSDTKGKLLWEKEIVNE